MCSKFDYFTAEEIEGERERGLVLCSCMYRSEPAAQETPRQEVFSKAFRVVVGFGVGTLLRMERQELRKISPGCPRSLVQQMGYRGSGPLWRAEKEIVISVLRVLPENKLAGSG